MTTPVLTQRATRAAVQVARDHGLETGDEPRVVHDGSNLLLHLHPAPVVARVATTTAIVREGDAWLTREVSVAAHVASKGAPTVAPTLLMPPGPHHFSGLTMTFWEQVEELAEPPDPRAAGRALRACHDALRDYEGPAPLSPMAVLRETEELIERFAEDRTLASDDAGRLREAAAGASAAIAELGLSHQAVHGDSHLGNVINTPEGPLWTDWEDTCLASPQWDLACLLASGRYFGTDPEPGEEAVAAYGAAPHEAFLEARCLQGTLWSLVFAHDHPEMREYATRLMAQYR